MASSPDDAAVAPALLDSASPFRQTLRDLDDRLKRGEPFSGHERNCVFLNIGGARWPTVSHVSGFDFDDDARALASTDWDGDGDPDVWVVNRTAPMVRYLRNDTPRAGDFLSLQLAQDSGNRHALGARVELKVRSGETPGESTLIREVRAGDSFLSQSSTRLHFGLGGNARITALTVRWPGGGVESFSGAQPNAAWLLRKGTGKAAPVAPRTGVALLQPGPVTLPPGEFPGAVPLAHSLPLPRIEYIDLEGSVHQLDSLHGAPAFITFVSGAHEDCAAQFQAWHPHMDKLNKAGLRLFAAGMDDAPETRTLLAALPPEIARGMLTPHARERVEHLYNTPFEITLRLSAPAGFSLDAALRIITIYRGPASAEQLLADVLRASLDVPALAAGALPFPGQWFRPPTPWAPLELLPVLLRQGDWTAAHEYMMENRGEFKKSRRHPDVAKVVADALISRNLVAEALPHYQDAHRDYAGDPYLLNNLAHCLLHAAAPPDAASVRDAIAHATEAVKLTSRRNAALLDTLALALKAAGRTEEAVKTAREGLALPDTPREVRKSLEDVARGGSP